MRASLAIALAACTWFASLPAAQAHAFIDHAEPAVGAKMPHAPKQVRIWFTETLEAAFSSIKVLDQGGHELQQGKAVADKANPQILQIGVPALPPGTYKVVWRAVSVDTHVTTGSFTFSVTP